MGRAFSRRARRCMPWLGVFMALARPAFAEDEVRIAIETKGDVTVKGTELAIFDGVDGHRLWAFGGRGTVELRPAGHAIEARGVNGTRYGRAAKIFVEAKGAVELQGRRAFYGRLEVRLEKGALEVVNRLELETYLLGIIGSEMSASWPAEALKAQAVAARTFALQRVMMARSADKTHDLAATVISQVYKGAENIQDSVKEAVRATRGEVVAYDHLLAETLFHSTCGGRTVSSKDYFGGDRSYLKARDCGYCGASSHHHWEVRIPRSTVRERLSKAGLWKRGLDAIESKAGFTTVRVRGGGRHRDLSAKAVRRAIGWKAVYSERFSAKTDGKYVLFSGRGFGHGVGMCQWGARGMAEAGKSYREILLHYYAGAEVKRIY